MNVFISWSGPRSQKLAEAVYEWLPCVIQAIKPWLSSEDINKGEQWCQRLSKELEKHQVAIFCLTPEALRSQWLHFEAGALCKTEESRGCTLVHGLDPVAITGPLSTFQHTLTTKVEIRKLLRTLNHELARQGRDISERQLDTAFESMWDRFESKLKEVDAVPIDVEPPKLPEGDALMRALLAELQTSRRANEKARFIGRPPAAPISAETALSWFADALRQRSALDSSPEVEETLSRVNRTLATADLRRRIHERQLRGIESPGDLGLADLARREPE